MINTLSTMPTYEAVYQSYNAEDDTLETTYASWSTRHTDKTPGFSPIYWKWYLATDKAIHPDPTEAMEWELNAAWNWGTCLGYF